MAIVNSDVGRAEQVNDSLNFVADVMTLLRREVSGKFGLQELIRWTFKYKCAQ